MKVHCDECNEIIHEGYVIHDGLYNYCSNECLHENVSEDDYAKLYEEGFAFWTTFEE